MPNGNHRRGRASFGRPRIVVKFESWVRLPRTGDVGPVLDQHRIGDWQGLTQDYQGITIRHVFGTVTPAALDDIVDAAQAHDPDYDPPNFWLFFFVDVPGQYQPAVVLKRLRKWDSVETAYIERLGGSPSVDVAGDGRQAAQEYQNPAPQGIDAEYAWTHPGGGGDGAGQRLIDIEFGWTTAHQELEAQPIEKIGTGNVVDAWRRHGTRVLGVICSFDHAPGDLTAGTSTLGITPNPGQVWITSASYDDGDNFAGAVAEILVRGQDDESVDSVEPGDVLLVELQVELPNGLQGPVEANLANYEAIRLATALCIVVVEAGGNGNESDGDDSEHVDLDLWEDVDGNRPLDPTAGPDVFRDSLAILVSAAYPDHPHNRHPWAPEGARIDCYAWGSDVVTASSTSGGSTTLYTTEFGGTSAASAIVAGAALAVQGLLVAAGEGRFDSQQMRTLLSNPDFGTEPAAADLGRIGIMPDLGAIIGGGLGLTPDVYIRDYVGDDGEPHVVPAARSPDIIVSPEQVPDPAHEFGAASGNQDNPQLSEGVVTDRDHYLYTRVVNRGGAPSDDTVVDLYWSYASSLIRPGDWQPIGTCPFGSVPEGRLVTVSGELHWPSGSLPPPGHYCFVAVVNTVATQGELPPELDDWNAYVAMVRENRKVAWRNFNVTDNAPGASSVGAAAIVPAPADPVFAGIWDEMVALPFRIRGPFDRRRRMRLRIHSSLPRGARFALLAPATFIGGVSRLGSRVRKLPLRTTKLVALPLNRPFDLPRRFPLNEEWQAHLLVYVPPERRAEEFEVSASQVWSGVEIGRVTWKLRPGANDPDAPIDDPA